MGPNDSSWHDVAQICLNGHMVNSATKYSPEFNQKHCEKCGAATITQCQECGHDIQGEFHSPGVIVISEDHAPAFCMSCGAAFPWTELKVQAAKDLVIELEGLSGAEKETLSKSVDDLVRDNPQTPVAATRFKKAARKLGADGASALKDILVDVVSKTAKNLLWPG